MDFNAVSTSTIENSEKNDNFTFITIPIQNIDTISSDQLQSEYILKSLDDGSFILEGPQVDDLLLLFKIIFLYFCFMNRFLLLKLVKLITISTNNF